jgi:hypothetical protein
MDLHKIRTGSKISCFSNNVIIPIMTFLPCMCEPATCYLQIFNVNGIHPTVAVLTYNNVNN